MPHSSSEFHPPAQSPWEGDVSTAVAAISLCLPSLLTHRLVCFCERRLPFPEVMRHPCALRADSPAPILFRRSRAVSLLVLVLRLSQNWLPGGSGPSTQPLAFEHLTSWHSQVSCAHLLLAHQPQSHISLRSTSSF